VNIIPEAGNGGTVLVAAGVFVNVSVGGGGVAVGMAAWVSAIIVMATAAAVICKSTGLTVGGGVACAPHALVLSVIMSTRVRIEKHFMLTSPYRFSIAFSN
jgi:hypothetical protein